MEARRRRLRARHRTSHHRCPCRFRHRGWTHQRRDRRLDPRSKDRRHRRASQPLGHLAWFCAKRRYRPELFSLHRSLRPHQACNILARTGLPSLAYAGDPGVGRAFWPRVPNPSGRTCPHYGAKFMTDVVMPQMGESIVEGTLTKWLKKSGDRVERDEPLFEISTDKVDSEIPAPASGTLAEILVQEGATVAINTVVARIEDGAGAAAPASEPAKEAEGTPPASEPANEAAPTAPAPAAPAKPPAAAAPPAAPAPSTPAPAPPPAAGEGDDDAGPLSPLVRRMARENNIDLRQVRGTGAGGRITKADV